MRWKSERAREVGDGYKIYYVGEQSGRNGVDVIVSSNLVESMVEGKRCSSRLMKIKPTWNGIVVNIVSAYAPQVGLSEVGLSEDEKETFWVMFDTLVSSVSDRERLVIGDLNGHVGMNNDGSNAVHGGWGYGDRNKEGETILEEELHMD